MDQCICVCVPEAAAVGMEIVVPEALAGHMHQMDAELARAMQEEEWQAACGGRHENDDAAGRPQHRRPQPDPDVPRRRPPVLIPQDAQPKPPQEPQPDAAPLIHAPVVNSPPLHNTSMQRMLDLAIVLVALTILAFILLKVCYVH